MITFLFINSTRPEKPPSHFHFQPYFEWPRDTLSALLPFRSKYQQFVSSIWPLRPQLPHLKSLIPPIFFP